MSRALAKGRWGIIMSEINPIWLVLASLLLSLLPTCAAVFSSYLKVSIVLSFLKSAFGTQGVPGTMVVMCLSFGLSLYVMGPTLDLISQRMQEVHFSEIAKNPNMMTVQAVRPIAEPLYAFLRAHSGTRELTAVADLSVSSGVATASAAPTWRQVALAFMLTELRQAFLMGFALLLPFLVIDLVVANICVGLGMFMVSPTMLALPLKLLLFVLTDGWILLSRGLIHSYQ